VSACTLQVHPTAEVQGLAKISAPVTDISYNNKSNCIRTITDLCSYRYVYNYAATLPQQTAIQKLTKSGLQNRSRLQK